MRPAIDLVYRSSVRAATEIPDSQLTAGRPAHVGAALPARRRADAAARQPAAALSHTAAHSPLSQPRARAAPVDRRTSTTSCPRRPAARRRSGARAARDPLRQLEQQRTQQVGDHDLPAPGRLASAIVHGRAAPARAGPGGEPRSAHRLTAALQRAAATLCARGRAPSTGENPSRAAAIASTPEPVPMSSSAACGPLPCNELEHQRQAQPRVSACAPVPNAWPGSITISMHVTLRARGLPGRAHVQRGHPSSAAAVDADPARGASISTGR